MNTSSIIPSICARYLSNSSKVNNNSTRDVSSNEDTKVISENCICYSGRLIYILEYFSMQYFDVDVRFVPFDEFILKLFNFCYKYSVEDFVETFNNMIDKFFTKKRIEVNGNCYYLIIL